MSNHIRHGRGTVRPFIYGKLDLPDFVREVFGAKEIERLEAAGGLHIDAQIGDSFIVIAANDAFPAAVSPTRNAIYVYVDNVDAAYKRALEMGATSIAPPENKPYQERGCGVKDSFGNTWYIATYTG